ncbi:RNA polymerase III-inhibiting protein maf1 [Rhizina undulata]
MCAAISLYTSDTTTLDSQHLSEPTWIPSLPNTYSTPQDDFFDDEENQTVITTKPSLDLPPIAQLNYLGIDCRLYELRHKRRISVATASKILANLVYSYKGMGLSMGTMIAGVTALEGPPFFTVNEEGWARQGFTDTIMNSDYCPRGAPYLCRERSLRSVINSFNTTLFNLGVNPAKSLPKMWDIIDKEMDLHNCNIYAYSPDDVSDDPYGDDGLLWSTNLFFFNKHKKRVCYLYLRALSTLHHSPVDRTLAGGWRSQLGSNADETEWDESEEEALEEEMAESKSIWGDRGYEDEFVDAMEV